MRFTITVSRDGVGLGLQGVRLLAFRIMSAMATELTKDTKYNVVSLDESLTDDIVLTVDDGKVG